MDSDSDKQGNSTQQASIEAASKERLKDLKITSLFLAIFVLIGVVSIWLQNLGAKFPAILWALAFLAAGDILGFLFGIPRVLQQPDVRHSTNQPTDAKLTKDSNQETSYRQEVNTNLEQISDWLTKIIVGIGLIELRRLPEALNRLSKFVSTSLGTSPDVQGLAAPIIIYFTILGFLSGYLLTRIYLSGAFRRADTEGLSFLVGGIPTSISSLFEQLYKAVTDLQKTDAVQGLPAATSGQGIKSITSMQIRSVLWVDNHMEHNSLIVDELKRLGIKVVTSPSTSKALPLITSRGFDAIITDMRRTESDTAGIELVKKIRQAEINKNTPVIIYCTRTHAARYEAEAKAAGANEITGSSTVLRRFLQLDS
jgi:CheY-like chemotaxis protein/uncharacterized integral membrane protein